MNYGAPAGAPYGAPGMPGGYPVGPPAPTGEVNTLATLSVVFAFVFAPVGAVLGHLALSQIKKRNQAGRNRAILGTTLSYAMIMLAIVALVIWLLLGNDDGGSAGPATTTGATATTTKAQTSVTSTVITAEPTRRPTVKVEQLQVGDCVEIQQLRPDPDKPDADEIHIYRAKCEVRDGVFQVTQITRDKSQCQTGFMFNNEETLFACYVKFNQ